MAVAAGIAAVSCGIFDTRDSNPPIENGGTPIQVPVDVDAVLENYVNSVAYKDQALYEDNLDESFRFRPDEDDRLYFKDVLGEDIFADWGTVKELSVIRLLFSGSESLTVSFTEESRSAVDDTAYVRLNYRFRQRVREDSIATYRGFAEIHLIRDESLMWSIDRWWDTANTESSTWGFLKGSTSS